jgi:2-methylcitrate dehydratase PrpD
MSTAVEPIPVTMILAGWIAGLDANDIPHAELQLARLRVMDTAGLLCAGRRTKAADIAIATALRNGGIATGADGASSVVGRQEPWRPAWAAFVHGIIAHCRDFDDTFPQSVVHPGSTIVSVALALGEARGSSTQEVLAAIVIGYEVAARLGHAGGRHLHAKGFHASGVYGPVIAAAVASRLLRLDALGTANALGLAGSMGGGLLEFLTDGSWSKWLHVGWSAFGGINAAQMAADGFRGPTTALEGSKGLFAAFVGTDDARLEALTESLGSSWMARTALPKYFPCAHVIQPYLAGILDLHGAIDPLEVVGVECLIAPWAVPIVCEPLAQKRGPKTEMDVIASLPFLVAAALIDGDVGLAHLSEASRNRSDLLSLAERVSYRADSALGHGFEGSIRISLRDGRIIDKRVRELGLDPERLIDKFRRLCEESFGTIGTRAFSEGLLEGDDVLAIWRSALRSIHAVAAA